MSQSNASNHTKSSSPSAEDIASILQLFKYRNIAWRYLLCFCLPLQQKILIKQLRIAHHRKSSLSAQRRESTEHQKRSKSNIFTNLSSLFEDTDHKHDFDEDELDDDDIPDFYHLPRIDLNELQTLFKEGRQKYELLKKIYITDKQQGIRNDMLRATAPPSEQYNDPSLRTRSDTIVALIEREDENSSNIFSRIDLIDSDWKSQDTMNKLSHLRSAPPNYSPPKPPPFIHRHNFEDDTSRKNIRTRFNTFTSDRKAKTLTRKRKKKKIFKMKVFQSKSANDTTLRDEMVPINQFRRSNKRRFSDLKSSFTPFSALSKTGKKKNKRRPPPSTPPPSIGFHIAKTPPLGPSQSTPLKPTKTMQIRSKSPGVLGTRHSLKNPSVDVSIEMSPDDVKSVLLEHDECYSDDDVLTLKPPVKFNRQRSLSEDDIEYNKDDRLQFRTDIHTRSAGDLGMAQVGIAPFVKAMHEMTRVEAKDEEEVDNVIECDDMNDTKEPFNVIEEDGDSADDIGTLLNATMNEDECVIEIEYDDDTAAVESLVVAAPTSKETMGTVIVPSGSAPPAQQTHEVMQPKQEDKAVSSSQQVLHSTDAPSIAKEETESTTEVDSKSETTSPIVIKSSNTSGIPAECEPTSPILSIEDDVFAGDMMDTKPELWDDGSVNHYKDETTQDMPIPDDYINISDADPESDEQSFGQIVLTHPLKSADTQANNEMEVLDSSEDDAFEDMDEEINDVISPLPIGLHYTHSDGMNVIPESTGMERSKRTQSMTDFRPYYLRDLHNVHEIGEEENKALWKQIMKDVNRTFQYRDFFRKKETRYSLGNLLYIWSRINHTIGYLQGMHDLASIITCAIYFDYKIFSEVDEEEEEADDDAMSDNAVLEQLLDPKYLEHDTYAIYDALLQLTVKLFEAAMPPSRPMNDDKETEDGSHQNRGLFVSTSNCSLYLKLHYIHHKLLKHFDLTLYTHFENIGLSPQLYMLRWIRVLFSREFYLDQIITLWDELFVSENLIEFIDYIVMAMIHNVRKELLQKKDMTIIQILQNYPKTNASIQELAITARQIQKGQIKFDFVSDNREFYSHIKSVDKMKDYLQEAEYLFKEVKDYTTYPVADALRSGSIDEDIAENESYYSYFSGPDIRIPGFGHITPTQKYLVKKIILKSYGTTMPRHSSVRMGYLVKRGSGDQSFFARKNLKIRWFVIDPDKKFSYFKNRKSFDKKEQPLRTPIELKGRAIRVVEAKYFCFEISGISNISKRAYLLFAKDFTDFVLWLHALMWCADKSLYEGM